MSPVPRHKSRVVLYIWFRKAYTTPSQEQNFRVGVSSNEFARGTSFIMKECILPTTHQELTRLAVQMYPVL